MVSLILRLRNIILRIAYLRQNLELFRLSMNELDDHNMSER